MPRDAGNRGGRGAVQTEATPSVAVTDTAQVAAVMAEEDQFAAVPVSAPSTSMAAQSSSAPTAGITTTSRMSAGLGTTGGMFTEPPLDPPRWDENARQRASPLARALVRCG